MNKVILTLLAIGFLAVSQCHASGGNVTVRENGTYTVGSKYMSPSQKINLDDRQGKVSTYNKPNLDTRLLKEKIN